MTVFAYLRVSTDGQDLQKNRADILHFANERNLGRVMWVEETASGRIAWRKRQIATVIDSAAPGDVLIVSELSRLGRSMLEIMEILSIATANGLVIHALKGNWSLDGSLQSKIVAMAFAIAAEIERDLISQRTKEALAARRSAGQVLGRPKGVGKSKLDQYETEIRGMVGMGVPVKRIAARYDMTPAAVGRWMKRHKIR